MSMQICKEAYQELIDGDIEWLLRQPRDLERDHIEAVLRKSVELLYGKKEQLMKIENIKFKAKRLDNGEWIIGSFVVMKIPALSKTTIGIVAAGGATLHEVAPSTVCQFTGLKDCEGNEIWEGDIVEREIYDLYKGFTKVKAVVKYMDGEFVAITGGVPYSLYFKYIKVVGNKFDKKE